MITDHHNINFEPKALVINFTPPLHTIDDLSILHFIVQLADTTLIHGHRLSEWCGHGPELEQDIAISNIALDMLGQARTLYQYAAFLNNQSVLNIYNKPTTEDSLAYLRTDVEYKNILMAELPKGDWGYSVLKQYFISIYSQIIFKHLSLQTQDENLKIMAEKFLKEIVYHIRWSGEWIKRLALGTTESNRRINISLNNLWDYTGDFFVPTNHENKLVLAGLIPSMDQLKIKWLFDINNLFDDSGLTTPIKNGLQIGGKIGNHTEHLGFILAEMQYLQRTYPNSNW